MITKCKICSKEFNAKTIHQTTCSIMCLSASMNGKGNYEQCIRCNSIYKPKKNQSLKDKGFCSSKCRKSYNMRIRK